MHTFVNANFISSTSWSHTKLLSANMPTPETNTSRAAHANLHTFVNGNFISSTSWSHTKLLNEKMPTPRDRARNAARQRRRAALLEAVRPYEGGTVINEWYTSEEYVRSRVAFLNKHPDYKNLPKLFPKAREEAYCAFYGGSTTLSAQMVRERELACAVDPLTPFMTTENTQTMDAFSSYPAEPWQHGMPQDPEAYYRPGLADDNDNNQATESAAQVVDPPQTAETLQQIVADLARPAGSLTPADAPAQYGSPPTANALGKRRARNDDDDDDNDDNDDTRSAVNANDEGSAAGEPSRPKKKKKKEKVTVVSPPPPRRQETSRATRITRIAAGALLPRTAAEATAAQAQRRATLLAAENPKRRHPDLAPEILDRHNLTRAEREDGPVRCVCGSRADAGVPGVEWIGCDGGACGGCWQHVACMGSGVAVSRAERETEGYLCHSCDPWRHREVLQQMRRGEL